MDNQLVVEDEARKYFLDYFADRQQQTLDEFLASQRGKFEFAFRMQRESNPDNGVDVTIMVTDVRTSPPVRRPLMIVRYVDGNPIDLLAPVINGRRRLPFGTNIPRSTPIAIGQ